MDIPIYSMDEDGNISYKGMPADLELILKSFDPPPPSKLYDRDRPYDGQPHTDSGERGKQEISGVTMRDVVDCFFLGCFHASGLPEKDWPDSVYDLPWKEMDIMAVSQNMACEIEKRMGIFPNLPRDR